MGPRHGLRSVLLGMVYLCYELKEVWKLTLTALFFRTAYEPIYELQAIDEVLPPLGVARRDYNGRYYVFGARRGWFLYRRRPVDDVRIRYGHGDWLLSRFIANLLRYWRNVPGHCDKMLDYF